MLSHCHAPMRETTETTTLKPERIVLCIDVSEETGSCWNNNPNPNLKTTASPYPTRLDVVKDGLQGFVVRKANLTRGVRHKFAICLLGGIDEVDWVLNFSDDLDEIQDVLRGIDTRKGNESSMTFDLSVLLSTLRKKVLNPHINALDDVGIVRAILVYGRSYMLPKLAVPSALDILRNGDMCCDLLYIHPKVDDAEGSLCQQVFDFYAKHIGSSESMTSYLLEQTHILSTLNNNLCMLLAHPLQRWPQEQFCMDWDHEALSVEE